MLTNRRQARILEDMKPLGLMLREWREGLRLSMAEAARHCGMSAQHYGLLERGERVWLRSVTFRKLAERTGIPLERLMKAAELAEQDRNSPPREALTASL